MLAEQVEKCLGLDYLSNRDGFAVYVADTAGKVLYWNRGATQVFGWAERDVTNPDFEESRLFCPEHQEQRECDRERVRALRDGLAAAVWQFARQDGSLFWRNSLLWTIRVDNGEPFPSFYFVRVVFNGAAVTESWQQSAWELARQQSRVADRYAEAQLPVFAENEFDGLSLAALYDASVAEERVGGDFYDAVPLQGGALAVFVGDVSGKGLKAASRATEVRYSLRAFLAENPDPSRAVARVNQLLCHTAALEHRETGLFTTLTLAVIDAAHQTAFVVRAGGEPLLHLGADGAVKSSQEPSVSGLALGILPGEMYPHTEIALEPGDHLLLYSDGITEARRGAAFFESDGIVHAAQRVFAALPSPPPVPTLVQTVMDTAINFRDTQSGDDMCLLAMRVGEPRFAKAFYLS